MEEIFKMIVKQIDIDQFEEYVYNAFIDDNELLEFYDRSIHAKTTGEAIENVIFKIQNSYPDANIFGVEIENTKVGYFVCKENLLISFGMAIKYRNKMVLSKFWEEIKNKLGNKFNSLLYSHNIRAIEFLKKGGMKILFDHITVLSYN